MAYIGAEPINAAPGEVCCTLNADEPIKEEIVERVSGMSFGTYLQRYMFGPLGLARTGYYLHLLVTALKNGFIGTSAERDLAGGIVRGVLCPCKARDGYYSGRTNQGCDIVKLQGTRSPGESQGTDACSAVVSGCGGD